MARLEAPASGVTVRMYRQGLGDCFLLAFPTDQPDVPFYVLIDCGVIGGTRDADAVMPAVMADIEAATAGDIHLLVITHDHWDHVSGFAQAEAIFRRMRIHNLWLSWTEDPADELARRLRAESARDQEGLRLAVGRARDPLAVQQITHLLGWFGDPAGALAHSTGERDGVGSRKTARDALRIVREVAATHGTRPEYRRPGEGPLALATRDGLAVPGARVYILGPPLDEAVLTRIGPSVAHPPAGPDPAALTARAAFLAALRDPGSPAGPAPDEAELRDRSFPFSQNVRIPVRDAKGHPFFQEHYGFDARHEGDWRRIDDDWLASAGGIALRLDNYTNNTSLVMAIELPTTGQVLLFAGDAQVGSWPSWDALRWSVADPTGTGREVSTSDLLRRTVLYKVSHHGTHHGTIGAIGQGMQGLELMTSPELVAMLPVDQSVAREMGWTQMPFDALVRRLEEKTAGRVLRSDDGFPKPRPSGVSAAEWKAFEARCRETRLYFEYDVPDEVRADQIY